VRLVSGTWPDAGHGSPAPRCWGRAVAVVAVSILAGAVSGSSARGIDQQGVGEPELVSPWVG
jgi:hypothetical protein